MQTPHEQPEILSKSGQAPSAILSDIIIYMYIYIYIYIIVRITGYVARQGYK